MSATEKVPDAFPAWGRDVEDQPASIAQPDQIAYVADMILELQTMARRADLTTLAGILDLAHAEAQIQAQRARSCGA